MFTGSLNTINTLNSLKITTPNPAGSVVYGILWSCSASNSGWTSRVKITPMTDDFVEKLSNNCLEGHEHIGNLNAPNVCFSKLNWPWSYDWHCRTVLRMSWNNFNTSYETDSRDRKFIEFIYVCIIWRLSMFRPHTCAGLLQITWENYCRPFH